MELIPELTDAEKEQFKELIYALDANELRLVRMRDGDMPVAALCIINTLDSSEILITPVARLINHTERDFLVVEDSYRR